jgi:hypothetical protein
MTVLTLGALSSAAMAQVRDPGAGGTWTTQPGGVFDGTWSAQPAAPSDTPLRVYFTGLTCGKVSNDNTWPRSDRDEPYVVVFSADLRGSGSGTVIVSQESGRELLPARDPGAGVPRAKRGVGAAARPWLELG